MELAASQAYANFRAWVPRNRLSVGVSNPQSWLHYDWGPRSYPHPIVCLHALIGSPDCFFHQLISLAPRGYRVLSVQIPVYWNLIDFCDAFDAFLDMLDLTSVHILAAGLGGYLALHYASRKPDRIRSVLLIHSFLSSANLHPSIPYSPPVLRWLPPFLVRSAMRTMLPTGRTSRDQANAAEFAIGHTMSASRSLLASRLALFISPTPVSRLHIPESRITLIDTLDRPQSAQQLSQLTASKLPAARRAFLKQGGDFPYLSVPDEVNVHIIVHLRRHAPTPDGPMPVPPPARPRPLPPALLQRKREEALQLQLDANSSSSDLPPVPANLTRSHEDVVAEARALVIAEQRATTERLAFEITRLREFLPNRDDDFIAAVIVDCDGDIDLAIANVVQNTYDDHFYQQFQSDTIERTVAALLRSDQVQYPTKANIDGHDHLESDYAKDEFSAHTDDDDDGGHDPLGGAEVSVSPKQEPQKQSDTESDFADDGEAGIAMSPNSNSHYEDATEGPEGLERIEVDLEDPAGGEELLGGTATVQGRSRHSKRGNESDSADGIEAYVTSVRVGMRTSGSLVGRGPAPFKSPTRTSSGALDESWVRPASPLNVLEGTEDALEGGGVEDADEDTLISGASLLEAPENPLELPQEDEVDEAPPEKPILTWKGSYKDGGSGSEVGKTVNIAESAAKDGWSPFRREKKSEDTEHDVDEEVVGEEEGDEIVQEKGGEEVVMEDLKKVAERGQPGEQMDTESDGEIEEEMETEEQRRLRVWSMSAVAAASRTEPR